MTRRSFPLFLAASAVAHLMAFLLLHGLPDGPLHAAREQPPRYSLRLVEAPPSAPDERLAGPPARSPTPPRPTPEAVVREAALPAARTVEAPPEVPAREEPAVPEEPAASAAALEAEQPAATVRPESRETAALAPGPQEPAGAPPQTRPPQAQSYRQVLEGLRRRILERISYPAAARRRGIQGQVTLQVRLGEDGALLQATVLRSSGSSMLDRAALELIREVTPYRNPSGQPLSLEIPILYRLTD